MAQNNVQLHNFILEFLKSEVNREQQIKFAGLEFGCLFKSKQGISGAAIKRPKGENYSFAFKLFAWKKAGHTNSCILRQRERFDIKICHKAFSLNVEKKVDVLQKKSLCLSCYRKGISQNFHIKN